MGVGFYFILRYPELNQDPSAGMLFIYIFPVSGWLGFLRWLYLHLLAITRVFRGIALSHFINYYSSAITLGGRS